MRSARPDQDVYGAGGLSFTSIGADKGFSSKDRGGETVMLGPRLAVAETDSTSYRVNGVVHNASSRFDIVGNHTYTKEGAGRWVTGVLSVKDEAWDEQALNPYASLTRFDQLPGVHRISPGHYRVTGPFAKLSPFVRYEWGVAAGTFAGVGIKTLTVTAVLDSGGRPVSFTASGRSASAVFTATETFGHYNKPVTIAAP